MSVAVMPISTRSMAKAALALAASTLPEPTQNTTAVWMSV